jgi:perosamine synthetase
MITTDDDRLAEKISLYRRDGMSHDTKYYHKVVGYNYRLTNMQAAVGVGQIERADEIIRNKKRVAKMYRNYLSGAPLHFQDEPSWSSATYWMNTPVFENSSIRDDIVDALSDMNIETRPFFYPLHDQPPYRGSSSGDMDVSIDLYHRGINLPSSPLLTDGEIEQVCQVIKQNTS